MSFKVTYAIDTLDTSPEVKFFDRFNEVEDYLSKEIERRMQWAVFVTPEERRTLEEIEHSLITIEQFQE